MSLERIEDIKKNRKGLELMVKAGVANHKLLNDFDWLVEQAEKLEQYERDMDKCTRCGITIVYDK